MKTFTPQQVIKWLKKQPANKEYSWSNVKPCGCLFTQFSRATLKNKKALCEWMGTIRDEGKQNKVIANVPFHNEFWNSEGSISREEAIARLEKMVKRYAYKVVAEQILDNRKKRYVSIWNTDAEVVYPVGEWAYPLSDANNKFLFVFKTREQARKFQKGMGGRVFKCEVKNPTTTRTFFFDSQKGIKWPLGTTFVDAVKLLKKV